MAKVQPINIKVNKSAAVDDNSISSTTSQSLPSTTIPSPSVQTVKYIYIHNSGCCWHWNYSNQFCNVYSIYINISTKHFNKFYNNDATNISMPTTTICNPLPVHFSPFPFTLKFLSNRIQKCQGCQLKFRQHGVSVVAPHDLIVSHLEQRPYKNALGELITPLAPSNAHYHLELGCVMAADNTFTPSALSVPQSVLCQLQACHREKLLAKFDISIH